MPYQPDIPAPHAELTSAMLLGQFQGLKALIDLAAAGGITGVQVDGVTTTDPGNPAQVSATLIDGVLHLGFILPRGNDGAVGPPGQTGPQGAPFAQAVVDSVTTLPAGSAATVGVTFDGTLVHFTFGLPAGSDGSAGTPGAPGEVTAAQLNTAISGTSNNTSAVATLDSSFADPDMESMRQKLNEFILAARR